MRYHSLPAAGLALLAILALIAMASTARAQVQERVAVTDEDALIDNEPVDNEPVVAASKPVARTSAGALRHPRKRSVRPGTMLSVPFSRDVALEVRTSRKGEGVLGPSGFRRRASAASNPMSPIGQYESRASAMLIGSVGTERLMLEGSVFNSQKAAAVPQSVAARVTVSPMEAMSVQASYGWLLSSERHDRGERMSRVTASTTVTSEFGGSSVANTALWGASVPTTDEPLTHTALLESDVSLDEHHNFFGRLEYLQRSAVELGLDSETPTYDVGSGSVGYVYDFAAVGWVLPSIGVAGSLDVLDRRLVEEHIGNSLNPGALLFMRGTVN